MGYYVLAISGGVDSVVLLDMLVNGKAVLAPPKDVLIVAHFDHGIRPDSAADARFVEALAGTYGLAFETRREELGKTASEAEARERRYRFLRKVAKRYKATIVTAHHADDAVETIAINLKRGTGWRGLAVLDSPSIERPLLYKTKSELYDYALKHRLEWVEDETNASDKYLRNRVRRNVHPVLTLAEKKLLLKLRDRQVATKARVNAETAQLLEIAPPYSRYFFTNIDPISANELLRYIFSGALTRPQMTRLLHAIKTAKPGKTFEPGGGYRVTFSTDEFIVETSGKVVQ